MGLYGSTGIKTILADLRGWITQKLGLKADSVHTHTKSQITDFPQTLPPSAHTHAKSDVTGLVDTLSSLSENVGYIGTLSNTRWAHLAPVFEDEETYHKGDIVRYNEQGDPSDSFYQFNTTHTGAWNPAHANWIRLSKAIPVFEDISSKCAIAPNQVSGSVTNIKAFRYGSIVTISFNIKDTFDFTVKSAIVVNDLMDTYPILPSDNTLPYDVLTHGNTDTARQALQNFAVSIWPTSLTAFSVKISQHNPSIVIPDGTTCVITYMGGPYSIVG